MRRKLLVAALVLLGASILSPTAVAMSVNCGQQFVNNMEACSNLGSFVDRSACGYDAAIELAGCTRKGILGF